MGQEVQKEKMREELSTQYVCLCHSPGYLGKMQKLYPVLALS
jgi:hypothetical protein